MQKVTQAFIKAQQCYQWGRLHQALELCHEVLNLDPENTAALLLIGMVYQGIGELEESGKYYQEALRIQPGNLAAAYQLKTLQVHRATLPPFVQPKIAEPEAITVEGKASEASAIVLPSADQQAEERARQCADFIPVGARVLDLSGDAGVLERFLPASCRYRSFDMTSPGVEFPAVQDATHIAALDVLERVADVPAFLSRLHACGLPVILTHPNADSAGLRQACEGAGFTITPSRQLGDNELMVRLSPEPPLKLTAKSVLVISAYTLSNFGDRLGYHLINQVLPASVTVHHATFDFSNKCALRNLPEEGFDLLVLGIGNSLFKPTLTDELIKVLGKAPKAVGIFGTQYRHAIDSGRLNAVLDRLHTWYARNEEDILVYGGGRSNVVHLGDWLASVFPLAKATNPRPLVLGREMWNEQPLDRLIQRIQTHQKVFSARVHPFLCALASADEVAYRPQREDGTGQTSGKFRSLLMDVFGCTYPEERYFPVDRQAVAAYKVKVETQLAHLRATLASLLGASPN